MYPNLYYAFKDLFGIELEFLHMFQSFGFFLAISFLMCAWLFAKELKRKHDLNLLASTSKKVIRGKKPTLKDHLTSLIGGFILGYKLLFIILDYEDFLNNTQGAILSLRGNPFGGILGAGIFYWLRMSDYKKEAKKYPQAQEVNELMRPQEHVGNMTFMAAIAGIAGAKLFDALEKPQRFMEDPIDVLFSFSGLTMYGGLIVGSAAVIWYAHRNKLKIVHVIDAWAPGLMMAYAVGRIGCQVAGDGDWGIVNLDPKPGWMAGMPDWLWAYNYPNNVNEDCGGRMCDWSLTPYLNSPVFPTPLYETIICLLLFGVLWFLRKRIIVPGMLFCVYLILNGIERFFIEKIRVNATYSLGGLNLTQAEIIAVLLVLAGAVGIIYLRKTHRLPA